MICVIIKNDIYSSPQIESFESTLFLSKVIKNMTNYKYVPLISI